MIFVSKTIQDNQLFIAVVLDEEMQTFIEKSINDIVKIKDIESVKILIDPKKVRVFEYDEFDDYIEDKNNYNGEDDSLDYYGYLEDEKLFPKPCFFEEQKYKSEKAFFCWSNDSFLAFEAHLRLYDKCSIYDSNFSCDKLIEKINNNIICSFAHQFWKDAGQPEGKDLEFWKLGKIKFNSLFKKGL